LRNKVIVLKLVLLVMPVVFLHSACAKSTEPPRTNEPAPRVEPVAAPVSQLLPPASPTPTATPIKSVGPLNANEIRDAVARVFEKVATSDTSRNPSFAVGDFNGDGSEDLAVVVKASEGALGDINNEMANWVLEDPQTVPVAKSGSTAPIPPGKRVRAEKGDTLLAIIHGFGPHGWRAPEAKQTFVLKNAAGEKLLAQPPQEIRNTVRKGPPLRGDVLNEMIGGKSGFVFWTGARYAWWASSAN